MASYRELMLWQKAFSLCIGIYRGTDGLPAHERYGLTSELRKTSRSVVCNIAEGLVGLKLSLKATIAARPKLPTTNY